MKAAMSKKTYWIPPTFEMTSQMFITWSTISFSVESIVNHSRYSSSVPSKSFIFEITNFSKDQKLSVVVWEKENQLRESCKTLLLNMPSAS